MPYPDQMFPQGTMGFPMSQQPPMTPDQLQQQPGVQHVTDVLQQYVDNKQQQPASGLLQQILSQRMQPEIQDAARSISDTATSFGAPNLFKPITPDQAMNDRITAQLAPYTTGANAQKSMLDLQYQPQNAAADAGMKQATLADALMKNKIMAATGMSDAQATVALKNAQAGYYGDALQRDLAEKAYDYQNNPQMAQARMMAQYMQNLTGGGQPQQPPTPMAFPTGGMSMPATNSGGGLNTVMPASQLDAPVQNGQIPLPPSPQQINQPPMQPTQQAPAQPVQGGGFNPMGAMLAKSLGLTDMQIGPNGQPMPIPGSMKIENGSVISFDQNGKPQSNIPVNPRAQGLFEQKLQDIAAKIDQLHKVGGTVEEGNSWVDNMGTQLAASKDSLGGIIPGGQTLLQGTPAQTLRDDIQADVKQALPLYMQAFGITPGMERAQAAQQMLLEAIGGAVNKSRQHLLSNLSNLSQTAGTGDLARQLSSQSSNGAPNPQDIVNELRRRGVVQ